MTQYGDIFQEHVKRYGELADQQQRTQTEMANVLEMLKASFGMMSDEERTTFLSAFETVLELAVKNDVGLTEAVRNLLESNPSEWLNAIQVRDRLVASGFDFSAYSSNPLASVHTVLKRFKRTDVKMRKGKSPIKEFKEYRWIRPAAPKQKVDYPMMNPNAFTERLKEAQRQK